MNMLKKKDWVLVRTHGNKYQAGFPDTLALHMEYGWRWIEIKLEKISYTKYQLYYFPKIRNVWVLQGTSQDNYLRLFKPANYRMIVDHNTIPCKKEHIKQKHHEGVVQMKIIQDLEDLGYVVMPTYGNNIQRGLPDLYLIKGMKTQWLEVKRRRSFTFAQKKYLPLMHICGMHVWVLWIEEDDSYDLSILKQPPNLRDYLP